MARKTITIRLTEDSIDSAIRQLESFQKSIEEKTDLFRQRLAEEISEKADAGYMSVYQKGVFLKSKVGLLEQTDVTVSVKEDGANTTIVVAQGEDVCFVEFGTGVFHNGAAGSSPHPKGAELGMTIGSYGHGLGKRKAWGYRGENGSIIVTHGIPASKALYNATLDVAMKADKIAREVFG